MAVDMEDFFINLGYKIENAALGNTYLVKDAVTVTLCNNSTWIEIDNDAPPFGKFIGEVENLAELKKVLQQIKVL